MAAVVSSISTLYGSRQWHCEMYQTLLRVGSQMGLLPPLTVIIGQYNELWVGRWTYFVETNEDESRELQPSNEPVETKAYAQRYDYLWTAASVKPGNVDRLHVYCGDIPEADLPQVFDYAIQTHDLKADHVQTMALSSAGLFGRRRVMAHDPSDFRRYLVSVCSRGWFIHTETDWLLLMPETTGQTLQSWSRENGLWSSDGAVLYVATDTQIFCFSIPREIVNVNGRSALVSSIWPTQQWSFPFGSEQFDGPVMESELVPLCMTWSKRQPDRVFYGLSQLGIVRYDLLEHSIRLVAAIPTSLVQAVDNAPIAKIECMDKIACIQNDDYCIWNWNVRGTNYAAPFGLYLTDLKTGATHDLLNDACTNFLGIGLVDVLACFTVCESESCVYGILNTDKIVRLVYRLPDASNHSCSVCLRLSSRSVS